ncbi:MAG: hypothetical protein RJA44_2069 [Pseudomonadota bacterium]|jgi:cytochrome b561
MSWKNTPDGYGWPSRLLHWLIVLLFIAAYASVELHEIFPRGSRLRGWMMSGHFLAGLSILVLVWPRLVARLSGTAPQVSPAPAHWQQHLARLVQLMLYGLMIAQPLLGWLMLNADDRSLSLLGVTLPNLIPPKPYMVERLEELHELLGNFGYLLIGGHAAAALLHHHLLRDNTLRLMLPRRD